MLKLDNTNVAFFSGCFSLALSLCSGADTLWAVEVSAETVWAGTVEFTGETSLLSPRPSRPDNALSVPPTVCGWGVLGPAPGVSSSGSKSDLALPPTTVTMSRRRLVRVGFEGGGGGLRIPLVGGLGRRRAGEGAVAVVDGTLLALA
jgi:hypothetical protein